MTRARNKDGGMSEAAFQTRVIGLARFYGWLAYHTHDSRRSQAGFPDLVLVRGPELIFAELKTDKGRVRPEQKWWLEALETVSAAVSAAVDTATDLGVPVTVEPAVETYLWRPADFDSLHARLARGRVQQQPLYRDALPCA